MAINPTNKALNELRSSFEVLVVNLSALPDGIPEFYQQLAEFKYDEVKDHLTKFFKQGAFWVSKGKIEIVDKLVDLFNLGMQYGDDKQKQSLKAVVSTLPITSPLYLALPKEYQTNFLPQPQQDIPTWLICSGLLVLAAALIKHPKKTIAITYVAAWLDYQRDTETPPALNRTDNKHKPPIVNKK